MAKARTGSLYLTKSGRRGRVTIDVDAVPVQKSFDLETHDKAAARVKLRRLSAMHTPTAAEAKRAETFEEASRRIVGASPIASKRARLDRLVRYAFPAFGAKP